MTATHPGIAPWGFEHEPDWVPTTWYRDEPVTWVCRVCGKWRGHEPSSPSERAGWACSTPQSDVPL